MWKPKVINISEIDRTCVNAVLEGKIPALVIKEFYSKSDCNLLLDKIKKQKITEFNIDKLNHLGPFLMAHTTSKKQYFKESKKSKQIFQEIFYGTENPMKKIHEKFQEIFPKFNVAIANENHNEYSECIIRVHKKGKKIPIHKDNVCYEGKEYNISNIDKQLSCVLHLQKSEKGGELTVYDKQWTKQDEKKEK